MEVLLKLTNQSPTIEEKQNSSKKMPTIKRSTKLIAEFQNGFAVGWKMAVGEWFRPVLDIHLDWRVVNGKKQQVWTQGEVYSFTEGDLIYADPSAYNLPWSVAIQFVRLAVQVTAARPCFLEEGKLNKGSIQFQTYLPDAEHGKLVLDKAFSCNQHEFVEFLRTGDLDRFLDKASAGQQQYKLFN